jgi:hypothetical protein
MEPVGPVAKKSTFDTVAGETAAAVAVMVVAVLTTNVDPAVGAVSATEGAVTVTFTVAEVTLVPFESVTRVVSAKTPAADGVQLTE